MGMVSLASGWRPSCTRLGGVLPESAARVGSDDGIANAREYLLRKDLEHLEIVEQLVVQHDPLHPRGRVLTQPLGRSLGGADDALALQLRELVIELLRSHRTLSRALDPGHRTRFGLTDVAPRHE